MGVSFYFFVFHLHSYADSVDIMVLLGHALGCSLGILFRKGEGDMQYDDPRLMGVLITGLFGVCQQHIFPTSFNRRKELSFPCSVYTLGRSPFLITRHFSAEK